MSSSISTAHSRISLTRDRDNIGPYQLVRRIGAGGMGEVYLAYDERLDRQVAVKRVLAQDSMSIELRNRFRREARVAAKINHPAVVQVYDLVSDGEVDCLVMEYVEGTTLRKKLADSDVSIIEVVELGRQIAEGMAEAHEAGIVHRDLKCENILLTRSGRAKISDFGIAKLIGAEALTVDNAVMGTLRIMSPEQASGQSVDYRSDLFSFGILLYEALTGRSPFIAENPLRTLRRLVCEPHMAVHKLVAEVPASLSALVDRLLEKEPERRPSGFQLVTRILIQITGELIGDNEDDDQPAPLWIRELLDGETQCVTDVSGEHDWMDKISLSSLAGDELSSVSAPVGGGTQHLVEIGRAASASASASVVIGAEQVIDTPRPLGIAASSASKLSWQTLPGRQEVLDACFAEADHCLGERTPVLSTIEASMGMGKTRFLYSLAVMLRNRVEPKVNYLRAPGGRDSRNYSLSRPLLRLALGLPTTASFDGDDAIERLDAAWSALDAEPSPAGRWAAALLLGAVAEDAPQLGPILATPGALHQAAAQTLALALRQSACDWPLFLLIDDIHTGDEIALDALEQATADRGVPLGVWVAGQPTFCTRRPDWGNRAASGQRRTLGPLDPTASRALFGKLLDSVAPLPESMVDRLCALAAGVPLYITELAGVVRDSCQAGEGRTGAVDADELLRTTDANIEERLGRQVLRTVPESLIPMLRLCAVLGEDFSAGDIRGMALMLGGARSTLVQFDIDDGLAQLCQLDILGRSDDGQRYAIRHPLLAQALSALIPEPQRRQLHGAALGYLQGIDEVVPSRLVRHAEHSGARVLAGQLYCDLAERSRREHRNLQADEYYTRAIDLLADEDIERGRALAGRGRVRYHQQRLREAHSDLRDARAIAEAEGDSAEQVALLLVESDLLDWCAQWEGAAELSEQALARVERLDSDKLVAGLHLACGRDHLRREQFSDAVELLTSAVRRAGAVGDRETEIKALLCLGPALVYCGDLDGAEVRFGQVQYLCEASGDSFHLAVAHLAHRELWLRRQRIERMVAELRSAQARGRDLGNAQLERLACLDLAEVLYWHGRGDEARGLAEHARELYLKTLSDYPAVDDHLLLARIYCSRGDRRVRTCLDWIDRNCHMRRLPPSSQALLEVVRLGADALDGGPADHDKWLAIEQRLRDHVHRERHVETVLMAAEVLAYIGRHSAARAWAERAQQLADGSPLWRSRLARLQAP